MLGGYVHIGFISSERVAGHSPRALSISNPARGIRAAMHSMWACCLTLASGPLAPLQGDSAGNTYKHPHCGFHTAMHR